MDRIVMHIDVNSAFLSWSAIKLLKNGEKRDIRNEVSVIAGDPKKRHGVIVAASVPAKKLGITPPITLFEARKIYKNLIVVRPDKEFYKNISNKLMTYLKKLFFDLEQYSIDECYIEYTGMNLMYGDPLKFAYKLKNDIYKRFGFTVNIGIGNNKLCAKMASDFEKPNKVHTLFKNEIEEKLWPLDISKLFMAGKSSCKKLRMLGINTIYDLAHYDENILIKKLKSQGKMLYEYANGIDNSKIQRESYNKRKSIGFSKTLDFDTTNKVIIYDLLNNFSTKISKELKEKGIYANTITITIRNNEFKTINHQEKLENSINDKNDIYIKSIDLLKKVWDEESIRLIGLSLSNFTKTNNYQLSLFTNEEVNKETDKLINSLNEKLGKNVIKKGSNIEK